MGGIIGFDVVNPKRKAYLNALVHHPIFALLYVDHFALGSTCLPASVALKA